MNEKITEKQLAEEIELLAKKEIEITSQNGLVTLLVSGGNICENVKINGNLNDIYKEELEEDFQNAFNLAREEIQKQLANSLKELIENLIKENTKEDSDNAITVENVS